MCGCGTAVVWLQRPDIFSLQDKKKAISRKNIFVGSLWGLVEFHKDHCSKMKTQNKVINDKGE